MVNELCSYRPPRTFTVFQIAVFNYSPTGIAIGTNFRDKCHAKRHLSRQIQKVLEVTGTRPETTGDQAFGVVATRLRRALPPVSTSHIFRR